MEKSNRFYVFRVQKRIRYISLTALVKSILQEALMAPEIPHTRKTFTDALNPDIIGIYAQGIQPTLVL
jgi:hypothetical protein